MRRSGILFAGLLLLGSLGLTQNRKRVAILNFDCGGVHGNAASLLGGDVDVGKAISDLLVAQLIADGKFALIERQALDKVLTEQNFSNSDRADTASAAKLGRILGVDAIVVGSIAQFGLDDKTTTVGGSTLSGLAGMGMSNTKAGIALSGLASRIGGAGLQKKDDRAIVTVAARMIDSSTAQILAAVTGNGEAKKSGTSMVAAFAGGTLSSANRLNATAEILGEATRQAVVSLAQQLEQVSIPASAAPKSSIEALVADVSGTALVLNMGEQSGIQVGDRVTILRKTRTILDPATQKVIRTISEQIGEGKITEVDRLSSTATVSGGATVKIGDTARVH